jgi:hypothetical protein
MNVSGTLSFFVSVPLFVLAAMAAEKPLKGDEIRTALSDHTIAGTDDGKAWQQTFQKGGATFYSQGSAVSNGVWEVRGDKYCSQWPPSKAWSCYAVTADSKTITFISSTGKRYTGETVN